MSALRVKIGSLELTSPLIPASGILPMTAYVWGMAHGCSAVCTKGLTLHPRPGNAGNRIQDTPSGMLNSIGLENPGVDVWIRDFCPVLSGTDKKIILNLACENLAGLEEAVAKLSSVSDAISALELNLSCPNVDGGGQAWGQECGGVQQAVTLARKIWRGDMWVKLTPQAHDFVATAETARDCGADAVVVANTWLGMAMDPLTLKPVFSRAVAGLSGAAIYPLSLRLVWQTRQRVRDIPIIGCGGVSSAQDALGMMAAGAAAVQVGAQLFRDMRSMDVMCQQMEAYLDARGIKNIAEITGCAH